MSDYQSSRFQVVKSWEDGYDPEIHGPKATGAPANKSKGGRPVVDADVRWKRKTHYNRKTDCIEWKGTLTKQGKSTFYADGKVYDHQDYAWLRERGELPTTALKVTCGTPGCVNVDHLEPKPERRRRSVQQALSQEDVMYIRAEYDSGRSVIDIAKKFDRVSEQSVSKVARRKSYLWVPEHRTDKE